MIHRMIYAIIFLWTLAPINAVAQEEGVVYFSGTVLADRRPVIRSLGVYLEREDTSIIETTHTLGGGTFKFAGVILRKYEKSYLVINEPGYKELRHAISFDDLYKADPTNPFNKIYYSKNIFILELERLPADEKSDRVPAKGAMAVDISQILPENVQSEYDLAIKALASGDNESAVKHLEKVVESAPKNFDATSRLGAAYLKAGQMEKAEVMLIRARTINPKNLTNLINLGTLYLQKGDSLASTAAGNADADAELEPGQALYRRSVEVFEDALLLDPQAPRSNFYLGTALCKIGEDKRAESLLMNALALDNQMQEARISLLNLYIHRKDYPAALQQISLYLEANLHSPQRERLEKLRTQIESAMNQ
jgi:Flp pilus assembly protein TadD